MDDMKGAGEEVTGSNEYGHIVRGKRTKRQRLSIPFTAAITSSSSGCGGDDQNLCSPTSSLGVSASTEEDEDMANCLILLAQGGVSSQFNQRFQPQLEDQSGAARSINSSRRFAEATTTMADGKAGFFVYECKTCNRCFPSFQALGGHRASHKRTPKAAEEKKAMEEESETGDSLPFQIGKSIPDNKAKMHECSICGSEFSSGQALGGHMRRHRTAIAEAQESKKERSIMSLDLNLPAPEDERDLSNSPGGFTKRSLFFAASAMVDCHY